MFFLFWLGSDVKEERRPGGFFPCPRCGTTQPCDVVRLKRTTKLYSVLPVWTSTIAETCVCGACGTREDEGQARAPRVPADDTWRCDGCGNVNPTGATRCLRCRAHS